RSSSSTGASATWPTIYSPASTAPRSSISTSFGPCCAAHSPQAVAWSEQFSSTQVGSSHSLSVTHSPRAPASTCPSKVPAITQLYSHTGAPAHALAQAQMSAHSDSPEKQLPQSSSQTSSVHSRSPHSSAAAQVANALASAS